MPTNNNGLNVRMTEQEMQDIEDFVLITLRKQGLRGYEVSIAKLMRYALRYMFRVHEKEFITRPKTDPQDRGNPIHLGVGQVLYLLGMKAP